MGRAIAAILGATDTTPWRPFAGLGQFLGGFWQSLTHDIAHPYRPEKHYMRGPGPAWQAKNGGLPRG
jgi:hypothetical protein